MAKSGSSGGPGGARRGGGGRKSTARGGGNKSPAERATSHVKRSSGAGRANATAGASSTVNNPAPSARTKRGPGGAGKEVGRSQSAAGKGRGGAPKRAK